jgi:TolB-like protein/Tfp pilus assembly protein PilF
MIERNADVVDDRRIRFRVGINLGDVIVDDKDLYGDAVNIAARLENLADPGGICISATVRDQIRDRLALPFEDSGEQSVKNIARPIRVYALSADAVAALPTAESPTAPRLAGPRYARRNVGAIAVAGMLIIAGGGWWLWSSAKAPSTTATATPAAPAAARRLSIVVLPFSNLGHDPAQQYFVDGITEDLTTDLSRIEGSFVISRNTAFTYKDKPVNAKQIGRELGVGYVLEGSVQRSGQQVRINAQLIDAETDAHLWAERFERDTTDLFALQNEITGRIAVALNFTMIGAEAAQPTANPDAQDYIFRARAAGLKGFSRDNFAEQIGLFERALALDPHSAGAQSWLAMTLMSRVLGGVADSREADIDRAEGLVKEALAASPRSQVAHLARGQLLRAQGRYAEAIAEYERVLALNRNSTGALFALGIAKLFVGAIEEVIPLEEQVIRLSPRDSDLASVYAQIGRVHLLQSRSDEAIVWLEKARGANPKVPYVHAWLAAAYGLKGESDRAAAELAEARERGWSLRSIARIRAENSYGAPKYHESLEATYFVGLLKAGVPKE